MSHFHRARFAVTLLLVVSALFVAAESTMLGAYAAGGTLYIHGGQGNPAGPTYYNTATYGHGFTGEDVGFFGILGSSGPTISACSVSSPTSGAILNGVCSLTSDPGASVSFNGTFTVGKVAPGDYLIVVSGLVSVGGGAVSGAVATQTLVVDTGPVMQLMPSKGPTGTSVQFGATWLQPSDTSCTVGVVSGTTTSFIASGTGACATFSVQNATTGAHSGFFTINATGSFIVGNVQPGQYAVQVTGKTGDFAQAVFNVTSGGVTPAGAFIQLTGVNGTFGHPIGAVVKGPVGTHVSISGSNFLSTDTKCSISSPTSGFVLGAACSVFTNPSGYKNVTGSFIVGNVAPGQYLVHVSGSPGNDFAEAVFNVTTGPFIQLFPSFGPTGTHVNVTGSYFLSTDTTCSISSPTTSSFITGAACSVFTAGSGSFLGFRNVTGSFIVGSVARGQYVVHVSGNKGDFAEAVFTVTSGPFIQLFPSKGPTGTSVNIEGSYFLSTDTTCSISSPTTSSFITGAACSVFTAGSGLFLGFRNVTGSFIVGNVAPGQYVVHVSGNKGDFAEAVFNVTSGPFIQLFPSAGRIGTHVNVTGSYFLSTDTTCSISSPTTPSFITGAACSVFTAGSGLFLGFKNVTGSFIVGNVLPGQYVVRVTGNKGDFAEAVFTVTIGPSISLSPATGRPGAHVNVNGTGFLPSDGTCTISSPGSNAVTGGSEACAIQLGTGVTSGSFIIGNVLPGQYLIQVSGNKGDFAQAVLNVTGGPSIKLIPATGSIGGHINVTGTGFLSTDSSCTIVSGSSNVNNPITLSSAACAITVGTGFVNGSFVIGYVPPGQYVIQVNGNGGDSAQAVLYVLPQATTLTLYATNATNGATVTFRATGFSTSDTGCVVTSGTYNNHVFTPNTIVLTSPTCTLSPLTIATGSFIVGPYATQDKNWTIRVIGTPANDFADAVFNVTASINVTPSSGTINTVFTYTGSGFESTATTCTATIVPPFPAAPTLSCYISPGIGQVSGSVIVPAAAVPGTYGIYVVDNTGSASTGFFTVGTPTAIVVLDPASAGQGQQVGVAGTGFNPADTTCTITAGTGSPVPWVGPDGIAPTCAISGGYASGSFRVSDTATGGYYLITVTGNGGDFASNFLAVTLDTTITTFSSTTTTTTSSTLLSTTTTSVATSMSISSTTFSTTGNSYTTFFHTTLTTVSGLTTTTLTGTVSTTQTQTTIQATTTSLYTTVSCGPLPCGFAVGSQNINVGVDNIGLLALLLIMPMLLRRLFS